MCGSISGAMPVPVSRIAMPTVWPAHCTSIVIRPPSPVNLSAFVEVQQHLADAIGVH